MLPAPAPPSRARLVLSLLLALGLTATGLRAQNPAQVPPAPKPPAQKPPAPIVRAIEIEGLQRYTREQVLHALGQEIGAPYDAALVNRNLETLWNTFHVRAQIESRARPDGVELRITVTEELFDLEPRFAGNRDIDLETLRRWAHLDEKSDLFLYQSERVRQRLLEGYHQEGYEFVEIDVHKRGEDPKSGDAPDVIFEIREGPQVRVKQIQIVGNRSLPETGALWWKDGLVHLAKTELEGPALFNMKGSKFVEETLQADLLALRSVYRDLGWLDAVVEAEPLEYTPDRSGVKIRIRVDEGEPYVVTKLSIRGVTRTVPPGKRLEDAQETEAPLIFDQGQLLALCKLAPGKTYQRALEQVDAAALKKFYGQHGYLSHPSLDPLESFVFIDPPELVFDTRAHKVEVTYKLQQGIQRWIREVLFNGSEHTQDRVLRREVDVLPGSIADSDEINRSLSRIYQTNYFNDDMSPMEHHDPTYRFVTQPDKRWVDLLYSVEEGRVVDFNLNGGIDSNNGLVGRLSLRMRNFDALNMPSSFWSTFEEIFDKQAFHGAGQTLQLDIAPGTQTNQASIVFVEPDLFGSQFNAYSLDIGLAANRRNWNFYTENRDRTSVRIGREFGRNLKLSAGITAQLIDITDIQQPLSGIHPPDEPSLPPGIFEQEGKSALNGFTFDLRYLNLDNRLNPYEGLQVRWANALYGGVLGGNWDFLRSQLDVDTFFVLGTRLEGKAQPGFKASLGMGIADPMDGTVSVPYTERYFLGGLNSLRGFKNRGVGPNTGSEPDGGETMLSGSLQYNIPLSTQTEPGTYIEREVFRFLVFADAGVLNVDAYKLDFNELRTSVGFGIGMAYPLPINLYFGFPMRTGDGDQRQTFGFNISAFGF